MKPGNETAKLSFRKELEASIIGACLLENCYLKVANLLSHKNFSYWGDHGNYRIIWEAMESIFPQAIDLVTVASWVKRVKKEDYAYLITELSTRVNSTTNIQAHALILLEIDIIEKFRALLVKMKTVVGQNKLQSAAISEIIDKANDPNVDVFDLIEASITYLNKIEIDESQMSLVIEFNSAINRKVVFQIKKEIQKQALFNHLFTLYSGGSMEQTKAILKLVDTCRAISDSGTVTPKQQQLINQL